MLRDLLRARALVGILVALPIFIAGAMYVGGDRKAERAAVKEHWKSVKIEIDPAATGLLFHLSAEPTHVTVAARYDNAGPNWHYTVNFLKGEKLITAKDGFVDQIQDIPLNPMEVTSVLVTVSRIR